jgi:hypothetical protein
MQPLMATLPSAKYFPPVLWKVNILPRKRVYMVSQQIKVDDLTGRLTTNENRAVMMELTPHPLLQHKLRLLIRAL